MGQPGMRITVNAAMRARDVSRTWSEDGPDAGPAAASGTGGPSGNARPGDNGETPEPTTPGKRSRAAKNERRRQGKRGATPRPPVAGT